MQRGRYPAVRHLEGWSRPMVIREDEQENEDGGEKNCEEEPAPSGSVKDEVGPPIKKR